MNSSDWNSNLEDILDKIRLNCIIFSNKHTSNHLYYMRTSRYFEIPTIVLSVISGSIVTTIGLNQNQSSMASTFISSIITILTSVKLYMKINENIGLEQELSISYQHAAAKRIGFLYEHRSALRSTSRFGFAGIPSAPKGASSVVRTAVLMGANRTKKTQQTPFSQPAWFACCDRPCERSAAQP